MRCVVSHCNLSQHVVYNGPSCFILYETGLLKASHYGVEGWITMPQWRHLHSISQDVAGMVGENTAQRIEKSHDPLQLMLIAHIKVCSCVCV